MIEISPGELSDILMNRLFDYCLLIPNMKGACKTEAYISEKYRTDFLYYSAYEDGSKTLDIHWEQPDFTEIVDLLVSMERKNYFDGSCAVCLYKEKGLFEFIRSTCKIENDSYAVSYYSDSCFHEGSGNLLAKNEEVILEDSFINQPGNHIKIIQKQLQNDPQNNQLFYLKINGQVAGYIALVKQYENIWDVGYIFTDENHRNKGYGTQLCTQAIKKLQEQNCILYYSFCENAASESVARKSGLRPCAERYLFHTDFKGFAK